MEQEAVVITGASTGIGQACALYLNQLGFQVFAGVRKLEDGSALEQQASNRLTPVIMDVTDSDSISAAVANISAKLDEHRLVGLVNNAGIAVAGPLEFIPLERLRRQVEVNVIGQIAVTQAFLPLLRNSQGRIVFISSISGRVATPLIGPYAASKFAVEALADSLRRELLPWGIQVSVIQPGRISTPIWGKSVAAADELVTNLPDEAHKLYGNMIGTARDSVLRSRKGASSKAVARAVAHALISSRPRTRYLVGMDAKLAALIVHFLPDRMIDRLLAYQRKIRQ